MKQARPYLLLFWSSVDARMERREIQTCAEARVIIQAEYERTKIEHVFGQVVRVDDSRTDIFPKRKRRGVKL